MNKESIEAVVHSIRILTYRLNYWISSIAEISSAVFMCSSVYVSQVNVQSADFSRKVKYRN
jgi:hypothetical protein